MSLDPDQKRAVEAEAKTIVLLAGPGSGKTRTLTERIVHRFGYGKGDPKRCVVLTFTNAAANELRERMAHLGMNEEVGFCGTLHAFALRMLREHGKGIGYFKISLISEEDARELLHQTALRLKCKTSMEKLWTLKQRGRPSKFQSLDDTVIGEFYDALKEAEMVDFDLILTEFRALLRTDYGSDTIAQSFDELYVDEAQDSAEIDWWIYDELPVARKFFVGDPDQSIYAFRGARVQKFLQKANAADLCLLLERNYRSAPPVTRAAMAVIKRGAGRFNKATVSMQKEANGTVEYTGAQNEGEEAARIVSKLKYLHSEESAWMRCEWREMAVLCRRNFEARALRYELKAAGIPVKEKTRPKVPQDWPIARLWVQLAVNPSNDLTAGQLQRRLEVDAASMAKDRAEAARLGKSINEVAPELNLARNYLAREMPGVLRERHLSRESVMRVVEVLNTLPQNATLLDLSGAMAEHERENAERLDESDGVEVCTIHAAKGREWDAVFLPAFEFEIIPGKNPLQLEEERRLAFVAITRARKVVHFFWSQTRKSEWKGIGTHSPSPFMLEAIKC